MNLANISRDTLLLGFGLALGAWEVIVGEGRPSVLTFVSGLLLSPVVLRADAHRRKNHEQVEGQQA